MWKTPALAVAALLAAATPQFVSLRAAPESRPFPAPAITRAATQTFAPVCKGDEVLDSRPDPKWVGQSYAGDNCSAPVLPARLDGATASREQVVAGMAAARRYTVQADAFQRCISDFVARRRAAADAGGRGLTPSQVIIQNHRILVSQRAAETADRQIKTAIMAFNRIGSDCIE